MPARTKSTETRDQENRAVEIMRGQLWTTTDQFRAAGLHQPAARIWGLKKRGYKLDRELYDGMGADGFYHVRCARYRLVAEPLPVTDKDQEVTQCKS